MSKGREETHIYNKMVPHSLLHLLTPQDPLRSATAECAASPFTQTHTQAHTHIHTDTQKCVRTLTNRPNAS